MNKLMVWWYTCRQARADVAYWQREAEKWQRKYDAAIQVRDQLSAQLEETQAALIKLKNPVYPDIKRSDPSSQTSAINELLFRWMRDKDNGCC